jgi:hypothetical protein
MARTRAPAGTAAAVASHDYIRRSTAVDSIWATMTNPRADWNWRTMPPNRAPLHWNWRAMASHRAPMAVASQFVPLWREKSRRGTLALAARVEQPTATSGGSCSQLTVCGCVLRPAANPVPNSQSSRCKFSSFLVPQCQFSGFLLFLALIIAH